MAKEKRDEVSEFKEKRRKDAEALKALKTKKINHREEFRKFFAKINTKLKLERSMENILWLHFESAGFDNVEKFEDGIKNFGYKI